MKNKVLLSLVFIILLSFCKEDENNITEPSNTAPKIQKISAFQDTVGINGTTTLVCIANDPDGDSLTYSWSCSAGTFPFGSTGDTVKWKAPDSARSCSISVIVIDGRASDQKSISIEVTEGIPCPGTPSIDYAGKIYNTILIGNQCWLKENLDVGTMIQNISGGYQQTDNGAIEKYCYDNNPLNCETYGGLYEWPEAMQYSTTPGTQGICPNGWHIPTLAEFETLENTVGGDGNALKAIGQGTGGGAGTNTSGFSALLAGARYGGGPFSDLGGYTGFWRSTEGNTLYASTMTLSGHSSYIDLISTSTEGGLSVRCLQD